MDGNFNASEMEIGYEIMKANYFKSRQDALLSLIRTVATLCNNITGEITFNEVSLQQEAEIEAGEAGNVVAEALGSMSPLVANNVLQVLTINEIRSLSQTRRRRRWRRFKGRNFRAYRYGFGLTRSGETRRAYYRRV